MPSVVWRAFFALLLAVHLGLGAWALVGAAELAFAHVPWPRVSNPAFSSRMLALQWTLIATASVTFIAGYLRRWILLPRAMLVIYGAMATVCAYQTFFLLTNPNRFLAMGIEYAEYTSILAFLFFSRHAATKL